MFEVAPFPRIRNLEVSSICNFNCPICVEKKGQRGYLSLDLLDKIIKNNCQELAGQSVWLHFRGEPLLHKDLFTIIEKLDRAKVKTRLSTNGLLLTPAIIDKLINSKLEIIVVSMITDNETTYKELRGNNFFEKVRLNIENLLTAVKNTGSRLKVQVMGLDIAGEENKMAEFIAYYNALGAEVAIHKFSDRLNQSRYRLFVKEKVCSENREPCHWLFNDIIILYNGDVTTCYYDLGANNVIGNLKDYNYSIAKIWQADEYQQFRNNQLKHNFIKGCKECSDWQYNHPKLKKHYVKIYPLAGLPYEK